MGCAPGAFNKLILPIKTISAQIRLHKPESLPTITDRKLFVMDCQGHLVCKDYSTYSIDFLCKKRIPHSSKQEATSKSKTGVTLGYKKQTDPMKT
jgi:hypothetical protein